MSVPRTKSSTVQTSNRRQKPTSNEKRKRTREKNQKEPVHKANSLFLLEQKLVCQTAGAIRVLS